MAGRVVGLVETGLMDHLMMRSMPNASVCLKPLTAAAAASLRNLELADFYGVFAIYCGGEEERSEPQSNFYCKVEMVFKQHVKFHIERIPVDAK